MAVGVQVIRSVSPVATITMTTDVCRRVTSRLDCTRLLTATVRGVASATTNASEAAVKRRVSLSPLSRRVN